MSFVKIETPNGFTRGSSCHYYLGLWSFACSSWYFYYQSMFCFSQ